MRRNGRIYLQKYGMLIAIVGFALLTKVFFELSVVYGKSMEPTLRQGQILFVEKISAKSGMLQSGQIIIAGYSDADGDIVKRVLGLPGDTVEVDEGALYVNGRKLDEPYVFEPMRYSMEARTVPEGMCFVLGDNRNYSEDSHSLGFVSLDAVIGHAVLILWPLKDIRILR